MLFDTHAHFDEMIKAGLSLDNILAHAAHAGVGRMLAIGGAPEANRAALEIANGCPGRIRAVLGYNRDWADTFERQSPDALGRAMEELEKMLAVPAVAAVGEIGLDFFRADAARDAQGRLFASMLEVARSFRLPVVVHSRAAEAETLAALRLHVRDFAGPKDRVGVQHCFTGTGTYAGELLALGFYISFSGIITFKNAGALRAVAAGVPADRLLIETDSPWLAPEPLRGTLNEPAAVRRVAETLAQIRQTSWEAIAEQTAHNAMRLFGQ